MENYTNQEFSFKELYDVFLKTTYNMEVNGRNYEPGEVIAFFNKLQIAQVSGAARYVAAHGGFEDQDRVIWTTLKEATVRFSQGVFDRVQFALMVNARLVQLGEDTIDLPTREVCESSEERTIQLTHAAIATPFIYVEETGERVADFIVVDEQTIQVPQSYTNYIVDYSYEYKNKTAQVAIGQAISNGVFTLVGKTKTKDDITGQVRTGIVEIPKVKLMSNLSINLGKQANPVVGAFTIKALPYGNRGNNVVMNMFFLEDDVDSDIQ